MGMSLNTMKTIYEFLNKAKRLDLIEKLNEIRSEMLETKEANQSLREKVTELNKQLELKSKVVYDKGICWIEGDDMTDSDKRTPICPQCWQVNGIANRLTIETNISENGLIRCKNCGKVHHLE